MTITVREGDFDAFFAAPFACYGDDAVIASGLRSDVRDSLDPERNPLLQAGRMRLTWFTAHRDDRIVGRITAHIHDESNRIHGLARGYFGMFDCIDDLDVARALLDAASTWVRDRDCTEIIGAFNLSITQLIGVVTEGFEHPAYTYQDHSPPHISRLLDELGFERSYPMRTFEVDLDPIDPDALVGPKQRALLADPDWQFRSVQRRHLGRQLRECCELLNDGFAENPMFVPLSFEEFAFATSGLSLVIDERLSAIAYHRGEPAGAVIALPDLSEFLHATRYRIGISTPWHLLRLKRRRDRVAGVFYSVRREWHDIGVNALLMRTVLSGAKSAGYRSLGVSWIADSNTPSLRQVEKLGGTPMHRLHLFSRPVRAA